MPYKDRERQLQYQRDYEKRNRERLSAEKKIRRKEQRDFIWQAKSVPCADCGIQYDPWIMDFDHVRGEKKYNLNRLMQISVNYQTIRDEIAKCEVVCSNCHRAR